ncbi:MAG TPA: Fe-S cluster assembly ATPase SufC [Brevefilum fermentans]|jgi:Fe-S cluster assembly ATP-binding protein|uniref:Component of SufBCD complex, ATP-binding component of ABC superfamily n=1 Tax=Candidatus Brevifilum fermentans TaxID=1986204 RepID=A0A1Y6K3L3_9CHLR|nr:Fe-S cluster assembly ATPase SufC [Brevefilum fermentans]MDI9566991.1 Fe-S cluster assembly ATPase SufC [Chloroflexota bacterium]SMX54265.1 component of SufBCD complex, ATP-binding component of ABC superfamily [Brevefilum fermentans]HQA28848.1 Fe-S cluster assembly ATPase SufC [Brevefilum fermentans]
MPKLEIKDLYVSVEDNPIIKGFNLTIQGGEVHAIMGPNGTGKSTLAYAVMGHPRYQITQGDILLDGISLLEMAPDERSRAGIFLAFQYPVSIPGVTVANFLRTALNARRRHADPPQEDISILEYRRLLKSKMDMVEMEYAFGGRYLNEGFSGGEKKRTEILQLALLEPTFAILDETDSGLDIDAIRIVSEGVNTLKGPNMGVIVITHYQRILNYLNPDFVHVMFDGRIVESGGEQLALLLEEHGYDWVREKYGLPAEA